jgi:hypothetical protein
MVSFDPAICNGFMGLGKRAAVGGLLQLECRRAMVVTGSASARPRAGSPRISSTAIRRSSTLILAVAPSEPPGMM